MHATRLTVLLAGLALCMCLPGPALAQSSACGGLRAVRKEIADMTGTEWDSYVRALRGVARNGVLARYVRIHGDAVRLAHRGCYFFPWHRQFLYEFERELNRIVSGVTIPYWDWTKVVSGQPINTAFANDPMWNDRMGGADGNGPIPRPPFQRWAVGGSTVERDFVTGNGDIGSGGNFYDMASSRDVSAVARGSDSYENFLTFIEAQHDSVHNAIGGSMGDIPTSPREPIFWSHHAYIDKIWSDWQRAGSGTAFGGTWAGGSCSVSEVMRPFSASVSQVFSDTSPCATYQASSMAGPTSRFSLMGGSVRQGASSSSSSSSASSSVLVISSDAERRSYLVTVAQQKQSAPNAYKAAVVLGLRQVDTIQRATRKFGMSTERIAKAVSLYASLLLKQGADIVGDASIANMSAQAIAAEGKSEAAGFSSAAGGSSSSSNSSNSSRS